MNSGQAVKLAVKKQGGGFHREIPCDGPFVFGLFAYSRGHYF